MVMLRLTLLGVATVCASLWLSSEVRAEAPPETPEGQSETTHPCPVFDMYHVIVDDVRFDFAGEYRHLASSPTGGCSIELLVVRAEPTETEFQPVQCVITVDPTQHGLGLQIATRGEGACDRLTLRTRVFIAGDGQVPPGQHGEPPRSRLAYATMVGFDPVWRPMWTTVARVSWSYTQNAIIDWSWDALIIETEGWAPTLLSDGSRYHFSANEIETWAEVRWYSENLGDAIDRIVPGVDIDIPVSITAKATVWAQPNGAYFCTFWDSDWVGVPSLLGIPVVDLEVHSVCAAQ